MLVNGINHNSKTVQLSEAYPCLFSYTFAKILVVRLIVLVISVLSLVCKAILLYE